MGRVRGEIYSRERARQINNFNGLIYGNITPTDVDGLIDFHGKCFVFIELKYLDSELPFGQKLALERIINSLKKPSICIVASHAMQTRYDVDVKTCQVREYFFSGKWHTPKETYNVKRMIDEFVFKYAPECLHLIVEASSKAQK